MEQAGEIIQITKADVNAVIKSLKTCFVDLEKAYDCIPRDKLWVVLLQYGISRQLLTAIKSQHMHSEVCVCVNSATTKPFGVSVGESQGCSLYLLCSLFIWIE